MDPKDVNRINYNNYYVGQNLDFLVRSKMRSESLSTPLTNTPVFYDAQVSSKMSLLGKRGYYDPGYIYGFDEQRNEIRENNNINPNRKSPNKYNPYELNERDQYMNQKSRDNFPQEQYELEMRRQQELQRSNNQNLGNNIRERDERPFNNNYKNNDEEFQREYNEYLKRDFQGQNDQYNRGGNEMNLPKTREQIQHDVYVENFKRQQLAKQMMMDEEMKYKQNKFK